MLSVTTFVSICYAERHSARVSARRHVSLRTHWKYLEVVLSIITKSEELQLISFNSGSQSCKRISTFYFGLLQSLKSLALVCEKFEKFILVVILRQSDWLTDGVVLHYFTIYTIQI